MDYSSITLVTPEEAVRLIKSVHPVQIDVRPEEMYDSGHIVGAINIPLSELDDDALLSDVIPTKDTPVMVNCQIGVSSAKAARLLARKGYTEIYDVEGGIQAWPYGLAVKTLAA